MLWRKDKAEMEMAGHNDDDGRRKKETRNWCP